jgi:hypothetical protein
MLAAEAPVDVAGWTVRQVNQETRSVPSGGMLPLCQASPYTAMVVRLRTAVPDRRVRVRLRLPDGATETRTVRLRRRTRVAFLPDPAFTEGRYRLTVRCHGRTLGRGSLRLSGGSGSTC